MALKAEVLDGPRGGIDRSRLSAIDLNHLHRQTFGNRRLQREILTLFLNHSEEQLERLKEAASIEERQQAAHSLVGSARGVGAFSVAYIAGEIELAKGPVTGRLRALEAATEAARFFIADLLAD